MFLLQSSARALRFGAMVVGAIFLVACAGHPPILKTEEMVSKADVSVRKLYVFVDHALTFQHIESPWSGYRHERFGAANSVLANKLRDKNVEAVVENHRTSSPVMWSGVWLRAKDLDASHVLIVRTVKVSVYKASNYISRDVIATEQLAELYAIPSPRVGGEPILIYSTSFKTDETCAQVEKLTCIEFVPNYLIARLEANRILGK